MQAARRLMAATQQTATKKNSFVKTWLSDTATYPIIVVIAGACGLVAYQGQRVLRSHPDITFNKHDRSSMMRENDEEAEQHYDHALRQHARTGETQIMPGVNNLMVKSKVKN